MVVIHAMMYTSYLGFKNFGWSRTLFMLSLLYRLNHLVPWRWYTSCIDLLNESAFMEFYYSHNYKEGNALVYSISLELLVFVSLLVVGCLLFVSRFIYFDVNTKSNYKFYWDLVYIFFHHLIILIVKRLNEKSATKVPT